jgi:macrocin-O-methyltransferase TylF-like protien
MLRSAIKQALKLSGYRLVRQTHDEDDGLNTLHNRDFTKEPRFSIAYQRGLRGTTSQLSHHGPWRVHFATWAALTALRRKGDFIECGVYLGFISSVVMTYVDWNAAAEGRKFFLIDSYEGISKDLLSPEELAAGRDTQFGSDYIDTYRRAATNLAEFKNAELIKGFVPDVLPQVQTEQVAYLHIDMNSAAAEVAALEYFWNKLVPGAVVLLDDYAYFGYQPLKNAIDKLGTKLGFEVASLPTGQGLIIK